MRYLFQEWGRAKDSLKDKPHLLFLADYDGTLTPIVDEPARAVLSEDVRALLKQLAAKPPITMGIVSGRSINEVKRLVGIDELFYVGNHGFEIEGPEVKYVHPQALKSKPLISEICKKLRYLLMDIDGAIVENKGYTLSVHYRKVEEARQLLVKSAFEEVSGPYVKQGQFKDTSGKMVYELRPPVDWNKGEAILWIRRCLLGLLHIEDITCIYLGDDKTDEDAFSALRNTDLTIHVGEAESSKARFFVKDVEEVRLFLERVDQLLV